MCFGVGAGPRVMGVVSPCSPAPCKRFGGLCPSVRVAVIAGGLAVREHIARAGWADRERDDAVHCRAAGVDLACPDDSGVPTKESLAAQLAPPLVPLEDGRPIDVFVWATVPSAPLPVRCVAAVNPAVSAPIFASEGVLPLRGAVAAIPPFLACNGPAEAAQPWRRWRWRGWRRFCVVPPRVKPPCQLHGQLKRPGCARLPLPAGLKRTLPRAVLRLAGVGSARVPPLDERCVAVQAAIRRGFPEQASVVAALL